MAERGFFDMDVGVVPEAGRLDVQPEQNPDDNNDRREDRTDPDERLLVDLIFLLLGMGECGTLLFG